ncbi:MAG: ABC transporter permease [Candidatus Thorarchaeota archaeon]|jgi:ABC-type nitrate/sulfonate/bicarbonate transport system permease component
MPEDTEESSRTSSIMKRLSTSPREILIKGVIPLVILLILWQLIAMIATRNSAIPIGLDGIISSFIELVLEGDPGGHTLLLHTVTSLVRVVIGFSLAILVGVPLGILIGRYRLADSILGPVVESMRPIPPIAWIPISILLFTSFIDGAQVFIIWVGAFFPILINTTAGVKRTEAVHLDVASTFGASESQILSRIILPSAAPEIFAGVRIGFGIGWMCLVAAEMIGGGLGLGYLVILADQHGFVGQMISAMLVIGVIGFAFSYFFLSIERYLLRYRQEVSV